MVPVPGISRDGISMQLVTFTYTFTIFYNVNQCNVCHFDAILSLSLSLPFFPTPPASRGIPSESRWQRWRRWRTWPCPAPWGCRKRRPARLQLAVVAVEVSAHQQISTDFNSMFNRTFENPSDSFNGCLTSSNRSDFSSSN